MTEAMNYDPVLSSTPSEAQPFGRRTLLPLKDAARRLGLTVWGLRAWVYSGKIASHKIGSKVCISEDEIARVITESERPASNVDKQARSGKKG